MLAAEPRLIGHNDELIQLPDGKIYKKVENPNGIDPTKLGNHLLEKHGILVTPIVHKDFQGLRVTPNIYATLEEIDTFGEVMQRIAEKGLS